MAQDSASDHLRRMAELDKPQVAIGEWAEEPYLLITVNASGTAVAISRNIKRLVQLQPAKVLKG